MSLTIYSYPNNPRVWKAQIAGKYVDVEVSTPEFQIGVDNKTPEFTKKNPAQKVPVLETPEGCIFESNAIARYVARQEGSKIYGNTRMEDSLIDQWIDFTANEIELPSAAWLFPIMGIVPLNIEATTKAKADIRKALGILNEHLATHTFLVGERISLADIVVSMGVYRLYKMVLDTGFRKAFVNLNRWYLTCVNQPNFKSVIGEVVLCEKMMVAKPSEATAPKEKPKKEQKPKAAPKKKEEKPAEEEPKPKKEKTQNALDLLPPSKLVMDEWKRTYSNNDVRSVAMPWFWENYDAEGYSLWFSDYKYNEECTQLFKTNNLVGGFIQRLDQLRKYGFGNVLIFGDEPKLSVSAAWLFRGTEVPFEMKDTPDFELYTWEKADHTNPEHRKKLENYWSWTFPEGGVVFNDQGKVFK